MKNRKAFTLVELLVVTTIGIALVAILLAATTKVLSKGADVQTRVEIAQLEVAIQTTIQTYRLKYIPSIIKLSENGNYPGLNTVGTADYYSVKFLKRMFPRLDCGMYRPDPTSPTGFVYHPGSKIDWNRDNHVEKDVILFGPECLVFFLGGPNNQGFSADPSNPANTVSLQPPAFNFAVSRLVFSHHSPGYPVYNNNYGKHAQPYLYFTSYDSGNDYSSPTNPITRAYGTSSDCAPYGVFPYQDPATRRYINPNSFQIISAGAQGVYGKGLTHWSPVSGSTDHATQDNQANFAPSLLRAGE